HSGAGGDDPGGRGRRHRGESMPVQLHEPCRAIARGAPCDCTSRAVHLHEALRAIARAVPCNCTSRSVRLHQPLRAIAPTMPCNCPSRSVQSHRQLPRFADAAVRGTSRAVIHRTPSPAPETGRSEVRILLPAATAARLVLAGVALVVAINLVDAI